jgi:replication factor C subunit 3/5
MWAHQHHDDVFLGKHIDKVYQLIGLNMVVYGHDESTVHYVVAAALDQFLHEEIPTWEYKTYVLDNDKHTPINLLVRQTLVYYEIFLKDYGSHDRHLVKHVINEISKNMSINTKGELCNKLIVLHNIHLLSPESLHIITVFVEKHVHGSRFLFTTNQYNRLSTRLKSHMVFVRLPNPDESELCSYIQHIAKQHGIHVTNKNVTDAVKTHDCHMERSLHAIQLPQKSANTVIFDEIVQILKRSKGNVTAIKKLRNLVYILLVNDKSGSFIINEIVRRLLNEKKTDDQYRNIVRNAAVYEHRSVLSERYIYHIEAFFMSIL